MLQKLHDGSNQTARSAHNLIKTSMEYSSAHKTYDHSAGAERSNLDCPNLPNLLNFLRCAQALECSIIEMAEMTGQVTSVFVSRWILT